MHFRWFRRRSQARTKVKIINCISNEFSVQRPFIHTFIDYMKLSVNNIHIYLSTVAVRRVLNTSSSVKSAFICLRLYVVINVIRAVTVQKPLAVALKVGTVYIIAKMVNVWTT